MKYKRFLDRLGGNLGFKEMDDWYSVSSDVIAKNGGAGLLSYYNNSIPLALQSIYPQHKWLNWKFSGNKNLDIQDLGKKNLRTYNPKQRILLENSADKGTM